MKNLSSLLASLLVIVGCGQAKKSTVTPLTNILTANKITYDDIKTQVITPYCMKCHSEFTAYESLIDSDVLTPGDSSKSRFYTLVNKNKMPKLGKGAGTPLSDDLKQLIKDWIDQGAIRS